MNTRVGNVYAVTPKRDNIVGILLGLLADGNNHVWHTSDVKDPVDGSRYATLLAKGVPYPGEEYWDPGKYNLFTNNCVERFHNGYWTPSQWNASVNYPGNYWWGW